MTWSKLLTLLAPLSLPLKRGSLFLFCSDLWAVVRPANAEEPSVSLDGGPEKLLLGQGAQNRPRIEPWDWAPVTIPQGEAGPLSGHSARLKPSNCPVLRQPVSTMTENIPDENQMLSL